MHRKRLARPLGKLTVAALLCACSGTGFVLMAERTHRDVARRVLLDATPDARAVRLSDRTVVQRLADAAVGLRAALDWSSRHFDVLVISVDAEATRSFRCSRAACAPVRIRLRGRYRALVRFIGHLSQARVLLGVRRVTLTLSHATPQPRSQPRLDGLLEVELYPAATGRM